MLDDNNLENNNLDDVKLDEVYPANEIENDIGPDEREVVDSSEKKSKGFVKYLLIFLGLAIVAVGIFLASKYLLADRETEKAKTSAQGFLEGFKTVDIKKANEFISKDKKLEEGQVKESIEDEQAKRLFKTFLSSTEYSYDAGKVEKNASQTSLSYKAKLKDFTDVFMQMVKASMMGGSPEEAVKNIDFKSIKDRETTVEIKLLKEEGQWKVTNPEDVMMELLNLKQFSNLFGS